MVVRKVFRKFLKQRVFRMGLMKKTSLEKDLSSS